MEIIKRRGPRIEPCLNLVEHQKKMFRKSIKREPMFVFCSHLMKQAKIKFSDFTSNSHAFNMQLAAHVKYSEKL